VSDIETLIVAVTRLCFAVEAHNQEIRSRRYELEYFKAPHVWLVAFFASLIVGYVGGMLYGATAVVWRML
jgi:hypothetical protein